MLSQRDFLPQINQYRNIAMLKLITASTFAVLVSLTPALAEDKLACDDTGMMAVEKMMMEKKEMKADIAMAMKENEMAAMSMKEGKTEECAMHLNMAQEELMKAK
jgi:hypothetical protein